MSDQGKVQIRVGSPLESSGIVTNVATNSADIKLMKEMAGNVTGKRIMPTEVNAKRGSFDEAMVVDGGSIILGDGVVSARNLVRSQALIVDKAQIGNAISGYQSQQWATGLPWRLPEGTQYAPGMEPGGVASRLAQMARTAYNAPQIVESNGPSRQDMERWLESAMRKFGPQ